MAKIEQKTQVLLNNLCTIFSIPKSLTLPDPAAAARLLLAVYTMPLQRTQTQRRRYANQILAATEGHFDRWSPFVGMLGRIVITMQELPFHYTNISRSTAALVQRYQSLARIVWWIKASGLAAGAGAAGSVNAGVAEAIKAGSVRAAAKKAGARAIGFGAIPEATAQRLGARMPKGMGAGVASVVIAGATISYYSAEREMQEIRAMLLHRFQSGQASDADYRVVIGGPVDPGAVKRYWEMGS